MPDQETHVVLKNSIYFSGNHFIIFLRVDRVTHSKNITLRVTSALPLLPRVNYLMHAIQGLDVHYFHSTPLKLSQRVTILEQAKLLFTYIQLVFSVLLIFQSTWLTWNQYHFCFPRLHFNFDFCPFSRGSKVCIFSPHLQRGKYLTKSWWNINLMDIFVVEFKGYHIYFRGNS